MDLQKHNGLYRRMLVAVAQEHPNQVLDFQKVMPEYAGEPRVLADFLDKMGTSDPYSAAKRAVLRRAVFGTPQGKRTSSGYGTSSSGHHLSDQLFIFTNSLQPSSDWRSGAQACTKIMEAFGTPPQKEALTEEGRERITRKKKQQAIETARKFTSTLEEVLLDPSKVADVQSRNDRRKVHTILGLDDELRRRLLLLDGVIYGDTSFVTPESSTFLLGAEKGGTFLGWFKRNYTQLPETIQEIFSTFTSPVVEIPESERQFLLGSLIVYAANHVPIKREAAIGGYQKDLDFVMRAENASIREKYGEPNLGKIRHILSRAEITLMEATQVFNAYPIDKVRREVNGAFAQRYAREVNEIVSRLESFFVTCGSWREDCYGASVPMGRLKESPLGACLDRDDFAAVRNYLRLKELASERYTQAMPILEFQGLIRDVVVAARKVRSLEKRVAAKGEAIPSAEKDSHFSSFWRMQMYHSGEFALLEDHEVAWGITYDEAKKRCDTVFSASDFWRKKKDERNLFAGVGLVHSTHKEQLSTIINAANQWEPAGALRSFEGPAKDAYANPLVLHGLFVEPRVPIEYIHKTEAEIIRNLAAANGQLAEYKRAVGKAIYDSAIAEAKKQKGKRIYDGTFVPAPTVSYQMYLNNPAFATFGKIQVAHPRIVLAEREARERSAVAYDKLPDGWFKRALVVTSKEISPVLQGEERAGDSSNHTTLHYARDGKCYFTRSFVEAVLARHEELNERANARAPVVTTGREEYARGELHQQYVMSAKVPISEQKAFRNEVHSLLPTRDPEVLASQGNLPKYIIAPLLDKVAAYATKTGKQFPVTVVPH